MPFFVFIVALLALAATAPLQVTVYVVCGTLVVLLIAQKTVELLTGVASSMGEVLNSVGLAVLLSGAAMFAATSFNYHFQGVSTLQVPIVGIAFTAGFMLGMRIGLLRAMVVAAVMTATTMAMVMAAMALMR